MKIKLALLFILIMFLSNDWDICAKTHKLMPTIKFEGKVKNKIPDGLGTIRIEKRHEDPFQIHGFFCGDSIKDAVCPFGGATICGTFEYHLEKNDEQGLYTLSFIVRNGKYNDYDIVDFGPITIQNTYLDNSGRGKLYRELEDTKISGAGYITAKELISSRNNKITSYNINEVVHKLELGYRDHEWDSRRREYYTTFDATFEPVKIRYNNGVTLTVFPENKEKYILESDRGNKLFFSEDGEIEKNSIIILGDKNELKILKVYRSSVYGSHANQYELVYKDGTKYTGSFNGIDDRMFDLPNITHYLSKLEKATAADFKPLNGKIYYGLDYNQPNEPQYDEYINGEKKSVIDARKKKEKEAEDRLFAEKQKRQKEQEAAEYNKWVSQYGKRAAQAIKNYQPYVGMPEKAFRHIYGYSLKEETANSRVYVSYGKIYGEIWNGGYDPNAISCIVVCSGGKIVRITKP